MHWAILIRILLTSGHASEYGQANALIESFNVDYVLADKGYDSDQFIKLLEQTGAKAVFHHGETVRCNENMIVNCIKKEI